MTFEESRERLKERYEALTQSVELLYRDLQLKGGNRAQLRDRSRFHQELGKKCGLSRTPISDLEGDN